MANDPGYISDSSSGEYLDIGELEDLLPPQTEIESGPQVIEEIEISPSSQSEKTKANKATSLHARAYQIEMLEESLKQNIIVAVATCRMSTRLMITLQGCAANSSRARTSYGSWPKPSLSVNSNLKPLGLEFPSAQVKLLTGNDNVDAWSDPSIWNAFLQNVNVVVSTYQVLTDAVYHAFVQLSNLTLLVFDEGMYYQYHACLHVANENLAHNCTGKSAGSRLMARYRDYKASGRPVPFVLGLTASPIIGSNPDALEDLEKTLDAVCKTPLRHRAELLSMVNRPLLSIQPFDIQPPSGRITPTPLMSSLHRVYHGLDIRRDPFVVRKMAENTERSRIELGKALDKNDTYVFKQIRSLCRTSEEICRELGHYAADYFIRTYLAQFVNSVQTNKVLYSSWEFNEKHYLSTVFGQVDTQLSSTENTNISLKLQALINLLMECEADTLGIIFVKETGTVKVLIHMISTHPVLGGRFRAGVMVGTSRYPARRRDIGELDHEASLALDRFRSGELDLLIATDVLEEGIDVPACNLVICFDQPAVLKSFIQRRGRARMRESRLIILVEGGSGPHREWQQLEEDMKRKYEDDQRHLSELDDLEHVEDEEAYVAPFCIPTTGAQLDFDQGKPHLEHFCAVLGSRQYIDTRPYYVLEETKLPKGSHIRATVVLPPIIPPGLRRVQGANTWISESNACKDAAFQAFVALYKAKLINDHLMPLKDHELLRGVDQRASIIEVNDQWSPWPDIAGLWSNSQAYCHPLSITGPDGEVLNEFDVILPVRIPNLRNFELYWDTIPWTAAFGVSYRIEKGGINYDQTTALIKLAYGHRLKNRDFGQHVVQFRPKQGSVSVDDLGQHQFTQEMSLSADGNIPFLVRINVNNLNDAPYFYDQFLPSRPCEDLVKERNRYQLKDYTGEEPWLALKKWPRRRDFLHVIPTYPGSGDAASIKPYGSAWPLSFCKVDATPISNVQLGSLIPSITHILEIHLVAQRLCETRLKSLQISERNLFMVVTAISSPEAREATRYEQYEFMGDSLLKLLTAVNVMAHHPYYPEGYLSKKKDLIVSNSRLYRSAIENGLDEYILTKPFTGKKWQPQCVEDFASDEVVSGKRRISTKTLADVVEALIWVSFLDGDLPKALNCIRLFIPESGWLDLEASRLELRKQIPPLEKLVGHSFANRSLLIAAVTHASYCVGNSTETSMERLEFLGDAILDHVIVQELRDHDLSEQDMHLLRTGSVNADLLGFVAMEWTVDRKESRLVNDAPVEVTVQEPFWKFMRFDSREIVLLQNAAEERHRQQRDALRDALDRAPTYPWTRLARFGAPKFFSDMFESVMGAVWLDTGDMGACRRLAERAGIMPRLQHFLRDKVDVLHPKNQLGQIAGDKRVLYKVRMDPDAAGPLPYSCKVYVGDRLLVDVAEGFKREEVQTRAAEMAYLLLKEHGLEYLERCPLQSDCEGIDATMEDV
ncbi:RNase3 domain-containing protein [Apiospora phragmitis]|uniref:RNase3 domain-containing protein n=1 Tax=Apiospora phragmitis TaxID=2905665 RepID=A0ABR1WV34_9PEZI